MRVIAELRRMLLLSALLVSLSAACGGRAPGVPPGEISVSVDSGGAAIRVLMLTTTTGFRHGSIVTARDVMTTLATRTREFSITATEDVAVLTDPGLSQFDVLFFCLTSGELPLSPDQKAAIVAFVAGGKGFMGAHSATDTLYDWPDYGRLVGAYFKEHPWTEQGTVVVEALAHPTTTGLGPSFSIRDEFYTFRENPRPSVQVLLRLDAGSVGSSGDYPLAWAQTFGNGRAYYNALGHFDSTWNDPRFQQQMVAAIRWVAGRS